MTIGVAKRKEQRQIPSHEDMRRHTVVRHERDERKKTVHAVKQNRKGGSFDLCRRHYKGQEHPTPKTIKEAMSHDVSEKATASDHC